VGVEEEFLLVDPVTRAPVRAAPAVARTPGDSAVEIHRELSPTQIELVTGVCADLAQLRGQLVSGRRLLVDAAARAGCRLIASGTAPIGDPGPPPVSDSSRYRRMSESFGALIDGQGVCGCHVHVAVPDPDSAVQVCNHLRPWLPVLLALATNSPFSGGRDTGHASWRTMVWSRWPIGGVPPYFASARDYRTLVAALIDAGVVIDRRMIYWHARPSAHLPTVEVRVADVVPTVDEAVTLAGLVRALVATVRRDIDAGVPAPAVGAALARAATWRAARDGLDGHGVDLSTGRLARAWELVDRLVRRVRPELVRAGDTDAVLDGLRVLRDRGSAAARQRAVFRRREQVRDVVDFLGEETAREPGVDRPRTGYPDEDSEPRYRR